MPWSNDATRRRHRAAPVAPHDSASISRALSIIDNRPLQHAAWSEFHTVRKRLEKAAHDLRRHEEADTPAYQSWTHATFPQLITALRELHQQVSARVHDVEFVHSMAALTGRSPKKLWREHLDERAHPETFDRDNERDEPDHQTNSGYSQNERASEPDSEGEENGGDWFDEDPPGREAADRSPPISNAARDLYRRLVQHLHPDRGGEWTPARERLWHEVQQAWAARDADWLARLEINWETTNDTLSPASSVGRLHRAIAELRAAQRDTARKLRAYRQSPAWRFTLSEKKRAHLHRRVEDGLRFEIEDLRRHLAYLNATIAAWESPRGGSKKTRRSHV